MLKKSRENLDETLDLIENKNTEKLEKGWLLEREESYRGNTNQVENGETRGRPTSSLPLSDAGE